MKKALALLVSLLALSAAAYAQPKLTADNIDEVIKAMTLKEKASLLVGGEAWNSPSALAGRTLEPVRGAAGNTRPIPRLGIPMTYLADGPAGLRIDPTRPGTDKTFYCTGFPVGTLMASSWDVDLVRKVAAAMGNEVLEYGADVLLAPGVNLHRNPLCGRNFEYYSEDPVLSGNIAAAFISGVQSNGVGTSIKHFAANNQETNRFEDNALVSVRALRELYLKNFEIAITKASPWTVMSSYNKLNGEYTQQSEDLLTKVLRQDWGFTGIVMTDWGRKAGTVKSAASGNDLMEPGSQTEIDRIVAAVNEGRLSMEIIDRNVRNMLEYIVRTPSFRHYDYSAAPDLKAHALVARDAAAESIVLLRNEGATLPLNGSETVALYGEGAKNFVAGGTGSGNVNKAYVVNMEEGLQNAGFKLGRAGDKAAGNDVAVIVIRRNAGEGADRKVTDDFELRSDERALIADVSDSFHKAGKKVIVVLNVGGVIETASWKGQVDAILLPWSPGQEGANAVADILAGKVNPSGKLPMTFPVAYFDIPSSFNFPYDYSRNAVRRTGGAPVKDVDQTDYMEGIWVGYRYFDIVRKPVSFPFGFGLSYTSFQYSHPTVKAGPDGFKATVTVTNTGKLAGKEVVELFVTAPSGGLDKPAKELKGFAKTRLLKPGESQTLTFEISSYETASFDQEANRWIAADGVYTVHFCASVEDVRCSASFKLAKPHTWEVSDAFQK